MPDGFLVFVESVIGRPAWRLMASGGRVFQGIRPLRIVRLFGFGNKRDYGFGIWGLLSIQLGRTSAPLVPQPAHTIRGPNDGTVRPAS